MSAIMKKLKNGSHFVNIDHTVKFQITDPLKIWVSSFQSVDRNGISALAIMKKMKNGSHFFNIHHMNVTGSNLLCKQHIVLNHVFFRYESSGRKIRGFQQRSWSATILHRENIIQAGCD